MVQHESQRRILLEAGTEGGSVGIAEDRSPSKTMFVCFVNDCTSEFLSESDGDGLPSAAPVETAFDSLLDALRFLERYRWWLFFPLEVAPDFRGVIKDELANKGVDWLVTIADSP